jgi:hypothetical protein
MQKGTGGDVEIIAVGGHQSYNLLKRTPRITSYSILTPDRQKNRPSALRLQTVFIAGRHAVSA